MKKTSRGKFSLAERFGKKKNTKKFGSDLNGEDVEETQLVASLDEIKSSKSRAADDETMEDGRGESRSKKQNGKSLASLVKLSKPIEDEASFGSENDEDDDYNTASSEMMLSLAERIAKNDEEGKAAPRRRVVMGGKDIENQFAAQPKVSVSLTDLLGDDQGEGKGLLKRRLEKLSSEKVQSFAPTVSKVEQDRAERKVAFEQAADKLDNWEGIVMNNRKVKLSFPLNDKSTIERPSIRSILPKPSSASAEPRTSLEKEIAEALEASGLATEKDVLKNEQASLDKLPDQEEAKKRHAELAKMRALLFYSEQKARRINKIKSKTFRKLRKRRLNREEEKALEQLRESDPEAAKAHEEKLALQRAQERMSLRHKNTSKNMRELSRRHKYGLDTGDRDEELNKRMRSISQGSDDEEMSGESEDDDVQTLAQKHLDRVQQELDEKDAAMTDAKGIFALQFMKRGMQKERAHALQQAQQLIGELTGEGSQVADKVSTQLGKRSFGTGTVALPSVTGKGKKIASSRTEKEAAPLFEAPEFSSGEEEADEPEEKEEAAEAEERDEEEKQEGIAAALVQETTTDSNNEATEEETNPWLQPAAPTTRSQTKPVQMPGIAVDKVLEKISTSVREEDKSSKRRVNGAASAAADIESKDEDDEEMDQKELVRRAFADVMQQDFAREQEQLEEEKLKAEAKPGKIEGWGTWAGFGAPSPAPSRSGNKKHNNNNMSEAAAPTATKKRSNVIVSSRTNKLQKKYQVDTVPYPFTSREQYERSLVDPVGPEWNTTKQYQKKVQPDVTVKVGAIIEPLKFSKSAAGANNGSNHRQRKQMPSRKKL